ncbi:MAG TPA: hypothetical protein RMH85_08595 [Polyangiaceae bacterium LLY-WYZ-15_(1-7)]|nr:hypothetical protein [Myxococcales bacterium]MAT30040.1 hypothetical protein [Sandaracinus sp.]HJL01440.1 hypothetical protein [Polyangiaceae bacterium LLY-WYZ-15_(1-7)]MBJ72331.1 hypothetical protein [Sandaracinus sp.]HJL08541.1 hypothetical protein [Polyangiaceae bacterium LLY-WYZ-15_(1-7)]
MILARLALVAALGTAPFQCASDPDPERRLEDTPAEALWLLAERFREEGDAEARRTTLEQLVERYPTSREAERARLALDGREVAPDPPAERAESGEAPPSDG